MMRSETSVFVRLARHLAPAVGLLLLVGAVGCGEDDDEPDVPDAADTTVAPPDARDTRLDAAAPDDVEGDVAPDADTGRVDTTGRDAGPTDAPDRDTGPGPADGADIGADAGGGPPDRQFTRMVGTSAEDQAFDVATDQEQNAYVVGRSAAALGNRSYNGGEYDGFLIKIDDAGNPQFARMIGSDGTDEARAVATNARGEVFVTGRTTAGIGDRSYRGGQRDAFVVKFDASGSRQWTRMVGGEGRDEAAGVASDATGAVYVGGATDGDIGAQSGNPASIDGFLAKYGPDGDRQYVRLQRTTQTEQTLAVAVDGEQAVYAAGYTGGSFDDQSPEGEIDAFVIRYSPDGERQFARLVGTSGADDAQGIAVDDRGDIYIAGAAGESFADRDFGGGPSDAYLAKLDDAGNRQWTRLLGSSGEEFSLSVDARGARGAFIAGVTQGAIAGRSYNGGPSDGFAANYSRSGERRWVRLIGTSGQDLATAVAAAGSDTLYVGGTADQGLADQPFQGGGLDGFLTGWR